MHCELSVPGLFSPPPARRLPALELLLARGRAAPALVDGRTRSPEGWLQQAFELPGSDLPAGALTLLGHDVQPGEAVWARADPVHLRLMRDRLVLVPAEAFELSGEEAEALCEALNRHFGDALALRAPEPRRWCAQINDAQLHDYSAPHAASPLDLAGRDADLGQPLGPGARRWQAMLTEAQMVLHAHAVNLARERRGEPTVNSLWLWGLGRAPAALESPWQSIVARDPLALGLARRASARGRPLPVSADAWLDLLPEDGRHLALLDGLRAPRALSQDAEYDACLAALESRWFAPLLAGLRAGRVGMVTVHVPDAAAGAFETIRGDLRRFWRRPRPLARYA
jgi:hypothetical protein